jgi:cell division protein FtsQ
MPKRARAKVTSRGPTRAQQVADFNRKKHKQRVQMWKRRAAMVVAFGLVAYLGVGGWWLQHTGKIEKAIDITSNSFWELTADVGFRVDQVYLVGREHADANVVKAALAVHSGAPILEISLADIQTKLQQIPEVKSAVVMRDLPNALRIQLTERVPAALWQREGKQLPVDGEGIVLAGDKYALNSPLPVIVGDDAPQHVGELLKLLAKAPALTPDVEAAIRIGSRRWNLRLSHDVTVMLPERAPEDAWIRFAQLVEREGLLTKAIRSVDMRMEDRVFIMPVEQQQNMITLTNAKDT